MHNSSPKEETRNQSKRLQLGSVEHTSPVVLINRNTAIDPRSVRDATKRPVSNAFSTHNASSTDKASSSGKNLPTSSGSLSCNAPLPSNVSPVFDASSSHKTSREGGKSSSSNTAGRLDDRLQTKLPPQKKPNSSDHDHERHKNIVNTSIQHLVPSLGRGSQYGISKTR